ncbi:MULTISPECIES: tail fiber domain-containing protein [Methylobacteriaceae]|uniref:tail fiber domain-containing protein n=1 Tax=Methylobacteriaceae TaxID=119045 RepID=UPI002F3595DF
MSGGTKTQTTTENSKRDPYGPAIPALQTIIDGGLAAYGSGVGSQVYGGPRVAGLGGTTQSGLDYLTGNANAGMEAAQAGNQYLAGNLANGGATAGTQAATSGLLSVPGVDIAGIAGAASRLSDPNSIAATTGARIANGTYNLDAAGYGGLNAGLTGPSQVQRSLQDVADGKYLGGANPYLDDIIGRAQNDAATKVAQQFSASGRYGSGRYAGATADAVAGIGTQARYQDYEAERARQAQAASAIDSGLLARTGASAGLLGAINDTRTANAGQAVTGANLASSAAQQGLAGQQALASVQQANNAQRIGQYGAALSGAQSDRAAALAGLGAVGQSRSDLLAPGQTLTNAGAVQDAARQDDINAMLQMFAEQQQSPWKQLGLLSELAIPVAGTGGTATQQTQQQIPQPGLLQQILGGGLATAGILGQTGAFSKTAGSAPGWLLSDARAKEGIEPAGRLPNGLGLYRYRYRGDSAVHVGVMAHEVAVRDPGAVALGPDGLLRVDYARATGGPR